VRLPISPPGLLFESVVVSRQVLSQSDDRLLTPH